jgi:MFS family permease
MTSIRAPGQTANANQTGSGGTKLDGNYWRLWWANAINCVGDGAFNAALPLLAVTVTKDPRQIALIATATYLPWLLFSLPAGVIVDRYDRATLMWRWQAFQAAVVTALAVAIVTHHATIVFLVIASFLLGGAQVVISNAAQSALPQFVPASLLQKANGTQYVAQTLGASALGPPLGSLVFAAAAVLPFGLNAASFVLSAALLAVLPRQYAQPGKRRSMRAEMLEGLRWLKGHKLLRTLALMLGMNTFCFQMGFATLVLLATETLHLGTRAYGLVLVGGGLGGVIGGLVNARIAQLLGALPALVVSYAANAVIYIGIGLAPNGGVLTGLLAVSGLTVTVTSVVTVSMRQQIVPEHLLGRVNSVYRMLGWGLMPFGSLLGGYAAQHFGLRAPFIGAGAIRVLVLAAAAPALIVGVRSLKDPDTRRRSPPPRQAGEHS